VALATEFRMTLLTEDNTDSIIFCRAQHMHGRRLVAKLSEPVPRTACVRIDCEDSLLLGEVLDCWHEGAAVVAVIELCQALTGLAELASLREDVWKIQEPAGDALPRFAMR
jgi:hypothetical protein